MTELVLLFPMKTGVKKEKEQSKEFKPLQRRNEHSILAKHTLTYLLCNFLAPNDVLSCQHEMAPLILTLAYEVGAFSAPTL